MDPIPITKVKITKERWMNTPIQYEKDMYIKDILEMMCYKVYNWINSKPDFYLLMEYESFKTQFIQLIYDQYL